MQFVTFTLFLLYNLLAFVFINVLFLKYIVVLFWMSDDDALVVYFTYREAAALASGYAENSPFIFVCTSNDLYS